MHIARPLSRKLVAGNEHVKQPVSPCLKIVYVGAFADGPFPQSKLVKFAAPILADSSRASYDTACRAPEIKGADCLTRLAKAGFVEKASAVPRSQETRAVFLIRH